LTLQIKLGLRLDFDVAFSAEGDVFVARQADAFVAEFDLVIVLIFDGNRFCLFI